MSEPKYIREQTIQTVERTELDEINSVLSLHFIDGSETKLAVHDIDFDPKTIQAGDLITLEWISIAESGILCGLYRGEEKDQLYYVTDEELDSILEENMRIQYDDLKAAFPEMEKEFLQRTEALESALKNRIENFRKQGGEKFDLTWWVIELEASEYAQIMNQEVNNAMSSLVGLDYTPERSLQYYHEHNMRPETLYTGTELVAAMQVSPESVEKVPCVVAEYIGSPDYSSLKQVLS